MKPDDIAQCGMIYAKAFPIEHWGIDWTAENAAEYLQDFFDRKDLSDMYMKKMINCQVTYLPFVRFREVKRKFISMRWQFFPSDKVME